MSDEEVVVEETIEEPAVISDAELIAAAYFALDAVEAANPMTKAEKARVDRIRRRSLMIVDKCVGELYKVCFPPTLDEPDLEDQE